MRNSIVFLFSILLILSSCNKDGKNFPNCPDCNFTCLEQSEPNVFTNNCQDNWECSFKIFTGSSIDLEQNLGVTNGNKNVFQMVRSTQGDEAIADDEFTNVLVFEMDETQNSFAVEDAELAMMQVHYRSLCFCGEVDFKPITTGCLQGEKKADGTWFVQGLIEVSYNSGDTFEFGVDALFMEN